MPQKNPLRYIDGGSPLESFAGSVLSVCPNCGGPALVTSRSKYAVPFVPIDARVCCLKCSFERRHVETQWLGPMAGIARGRCPGCGFEWLERRFHVSAQEKRTQQFTSVACPSCGKATRLSVAWKPEKSAQGIDPVFGLPLWLRTSCCGQTLWAYNEEHLKRLHGYAAAGLRERAFRGHPIEESMIARLRSG